MKMTWARSAEDQKAPVATSTEHAAARKRHARPRCGPGPPLRRAAPSPARPALRRRRRGAWHAPETTCIQRGTRHDRARCRQCAPGGPWSPCPPRCVWGKKKRRLGGKAGTGGRTPGCGGGGGVRQHARVRLPQRDGQHRLEGREVLAAAGPALEQHVVCQVDELEPLGCRGWGGEAMPAVGRGHVRKS